jgi:threonine/homoserine/homoserine lactone efflux protein
MVELMSLHTYLAFILASGILVVIPGPTVLTVISYSLSHGPKASIPLTAAVALGDSTALAMSLLGLGAVLAASAIWFTVVKLIGGLYLLYLGIGLLRSGWRFTEGAGPVKKGSSRRLFTDTYVVTALNPKSILFFVAFLPQFVSPGGNTVLQLWLLAASFVTLAAINVVMYSLFASAAQKVLTAPSSGKYLQVTGGSLLTAAGIWALLVRRPV